MDKAQGDSRAGGLGSGVRSLWRGLRAVARGVQTLVWLMLLLAAGAIAWSLRPAPLQDRTVLVLRLEGALAERAADPLERGWQRLAGGGAPAPTVRAVLQVLDEAARDPDIASVLLQLDGLGGGGLAAQREVAAALTRFRASGKKVVAWGLTYDQRAYYIAAHADEVYLHPMGMVRIEGYGRQRNYYREALDRVGISVQVVRAGRFKNAAETLTAAAPSPETQESDLQLYRSLWATYQDGVEKARRLPAGHLQRMIDALPDNLVAADGDLARLALDARLVDGLMTPDALRTLLTDRGARDERRRSFRQIAWTDYLARLPSPREGDAVALVVVEGDIVDGGGVSGMVGGAAMAEQLRRVRETDAVKAVVVRINSPGGSALGSELIRRELQLTRAAGKPVVVSMGDLAASGGYWVGMAADEIVADAATVTGSIGVFGLLPSAAGLMERLSVHTAGAGTTWLTDAGDPRRPPDPRWVKVLQAAVDHTYADFTAKAAAARKTTRDKIEAVAQGRVWSGQQARERGLVDRLGGLSDAVAVARSRAKLPADAPLLTVGADSGVLPRLLDRLLGAVAAVAPVPPPDPWSVPGVLPPQELRWLLERLGHGDPGAAVVHCLCRIER